MYQKTLFLEYGQITYDGHCWRKIDPKLSKDEIFGADLVVCFRENGSYEILKDRYNLPEKVQELINNHLSKNSNNSDDSDERILLLI